MKLEDLRWEWAPREAWEGSVSVDGVIGVRETIEHRLENTDLPPLHRTDPAAPIDWHAPIFRRCCHRREFRSFGKPLPGQLMPFTFAVWMPAAEDCGVVWAYIVAWGRLGGRSVTLAELRHAYFNPTDPELFR